MKGTGALRLLREEIKHPENAQELRIAAKTQRLRELMPHALFIAWWVTTSLDNDELEQQIDDKLAQVEKTSEAEQAKAKAEARELAMLRRVHGYRWEGTENELSILREVHEKWSHPARSDRRKYQQEDAYWNGDVR